MRLSFRIKQFGMLHGKGAMRGSIRTVAVVGGGTAGWLAACVLSARHPHLSITLVEAPNIPTIGVGEGTWPTMRETLASIGIAEAEFLRECDASFKQGSRFDGWVTGSPQDSYLHPFTLPPTGEMRDLLAAWQQLSPDRPFAEVMTAQAAVCAANLAPRQRAMPDYGGAMNYAYHLDAGKFAALLSRHATERLGVQHLRAEVANVLSLPNGDLSTLQMRDGSELSADLFLDCTGQDALLIVQHMKVEWIDRSTIFSMTVLLRCKSPLLQAVRWLLRQSARPTLPGGCGTSAYLAGAGLAVSTVPALWRTMWLFRFCVTTYQSMFRMPIRQRCNRACWISALGIANDSGRATALRSACRRDSSNHSKPRRS